MPRASRSSASASKGCCLSEGTEACSTAPAARSSAAVDSSCASSLESCSRGGDGPSKLVCQLQLLPPQHYTHQAFTMKWLKVARRSHGILSVHSTCLWKGRGGGSSKCEKGHRRHSHTQHRSRLSHLGDSLGNVWVVSNVVGACD